MKRSTRSEQPIRGGVSDRGRRAAIGFAGALMVLPALVTRGAVGSPGPAVAGNLPASGAAFGGRAELCSGVNAQGVGLLGEYFAKESLDSPIFTRMDGVVDFDAELNGLEQKPRGAQPKSARWRGWVRPLTTGRYVFHASTPGMRVVIARDVVATWQPTAPVEVSMVTGRYYPISVELDKLPATSAQRVRLEWTAPQGARFLVPRALLYLPTETVQTKPL